MVVTSFNVDGALHQHRPLEAQLHATLKIVPAFAWYALPNAALTFLNRRIADYLRLPKDHALRSGTGSGAKWDSRIPLLLQDDREQTRRVWSDCLPAGGALEVSSRVHNAEGAYRWFLSHAEPVRSANETLPYWTRVNLDIEERWQAEFYLAEGQRLAHTSSWTFTPAGFEYLEPQSYSGCRPLILRMGSKPRKSTSGDSRTANAATLLRSEPTKGK